MFLVAIAVVTFFWPEEGPRGPKFTTKEKLASLMRATGIGGIVLITIGGIYTGLFTPVEAAGVGAFFALFMLIIRRKCTLPTLYDVSAETLKTTGMAFFILIGGQCVRALCLALPSARHHRRGHGRVGAGHLWHAGADPTGLCHSWNVH